LQNLALLGLGTTADAANPFSAMGADRRRACRRVGQIGPVTVQE